MRRRRGRNRMIVGFTTIYAIGVFVISTWRSFSHLLFITGFCSYSNTTGTPSEGGTAYPFGTPEFIHGI